MLGHVQRRCGHVRQRTHGFDLRLHVHQHASHIGVMNDRDTVATALPHLAPLHPRFRVVERVLIGALGNRHALQPHPQPRVVHHGEHIFQPAIGFANEITCSPARIAILHHASGAGVDAELVFDGNTFHVITYTRHAMAAVGINHELGHHEKRNTFHAFGRVRQPCQHEMYDIVCHIVFAPGDEYLGAADFVVTTLGHRTRAYRRQIRTRLRLGEIHGTAPRSRIQLRHIPLQQIS